VKNEFRYSSFYPVFTSITVIICLFFFKEELNEKVLAIGMLSGSIIALIYLIIVALKYDVLHLAKPNFKSGNIIEMIKQLPVKVSASLVNGVNPFVDQFFSAQLIIGSITALNYGLKIPAFIISIFGVALGNVLLPYFSNISFEDRLLAFQKLKEIIKYSFWICIIIVIGLFLFSNPIVSLFYERDAFTSTDSTLVAKIQQMYLLQIPFYVIGIVMVKYLTAINRNSFMVYASIISLVLNLVLNLLLIEPLGVFGLALSTSIVSAINTIILYIYIVKLNREKTDV
jgi:putative peptidoglycan lipid II flippase